jgi:hypothetical protein
LRFSIQILRFGSDETFEVLREIAADAIGPNLVKKRAEQELASWAPRGANGVAIYNHKEQKLYEWRIEQDTAGEGE